MSGDRDTRSRYRRGLATVGLLTLVILNVLAVSAHPAAAQDATPPSAETDYSALDGRVIADGSSTVWPITTEIAERFREIAGEVVVEVEISGTGGGFRRFCDDESDIQNASRPITTDEISACDSAGVAYDAFEIGYDGITVVVNPENDVVDCLTVDQLGLLWSPDNPAQTWQDLDPAWPAEEIELYGPGVDSGTFDYFTEAIVGEAGASRTDYVPSENDAVLVAGVADDDHALGYFGFAYYLETSDELKAVAIDAGDGCVAPTRETIADGTYAPLSRPLFIYVKRDSLDQPAVQAFLRFYLANAKDAVEAVGYATTDGATYTTNRDELEAAIAGTSLPDGPQPIATPAP